MQKAFIFDLDGVMIDNERTWEKSKQEIFTKIFGLEIASKLGSTVGLNMDGIYKKAIDCGAKESKDKFIQAVFEYAPKIYQTAPLTPGLTELIDELIKQGYVIGIVSTSPKEWIDIVIGRLAHGDKIKIILSLHNRGDLRHKPYPDGYVEAIKQLNTTSQTTIILEDSNLGIASAKAAGAYTIGLKQNLVGGTIQKGADIYADNLQDVVKIIGRFTKQTK